MTGETFKPILAEVNTCMHDKTVLRQNVKENISGYESSATVFEMKI